MFGLPETRPAPQVPVVTSASNQPFHRALVERAEISDAEVVRTLIRESIEVYDGNGP